MAAVRDLYEILGVSRDATQRDIKAAYRRLARELHPDVNGDPSDQERFKEITGAYEILSDPSKRERYDTFGGVGPQGTPFSDIQDLFDMFFGGGFGVRTSRGPRSRARRGEDLRIGVALTFPDAAFGVTRDVDVERLERCSNCDGSGAEPGSSVIACRRCGGTGEIQSVRRSIFGTVMTATACPTCRGSGEEIPDPCERCFGEGRTRASGRVTFEVPAGVDDGMELRITGQGNVGVAGGPPGDLIVRLSVEPSLAFDRRGQDLHAVLDVSITQAALGGDVRVETLDGPERIRIEPGTSSGTIVRLKDRGVPNLQRRGRGDLFVTLHIVTPTNPTKEERKLLERLAELRGERDRAVEGELRRPEFG